MNIFGQPGLLILPIPYSSPRTLFPVVSNSYVSQCHQTGMLGGGCIHYFGTEACTETAESMEIFILCPHVFRFTNYRQRMIIPSDERRVTFEQGENASVREHVEECRGERKGRLSDCLNFAFCADADFVFMHPILYPTC